MSKTTAEKIEVMESHRHGEKVERRSLGFATSLWIEVDDPSWDWFHYEYRIAITKPKTVKKKVTLALMKDGSVYISGYVYDTREILKVSEVEVEFVVDGGSDEKLATTGKSSNVLSAVGTPPSFEDGSPQLEVEAEAGKGKQDDQSPKPDSGRCEHPNSHLHKVINYLTEERDRLEYATATWFNAWKDVCEERDALQEKLKPKAYKFATNPTFTSP